MKLPKLNLRDLFWLVVVVAMGMGWWLSYSTQVRRQDLLTFKLWLAEHRYSYAKKELEAWGWTVTDMDTGIDIKGGPNPARDTRKP